VGKGASTRQPSPSSRKADASKRQEHPGRRQFGSPSARTGRKTALGDASACPGPAMCAGRCFRTSGPVMSGGTDRWIRWTTTGCVGLLALIAGTVSCLHMHTLVELNGQSGRVAARTPLSVDGMIAAALTTLLADSRAGERGGVLPWALLVVGSVASLGANAAVAQLTAPGRAIAAWPSFCAYRRLRAAHAPRRPKRGRPRPATVR
jgi:Protein of unknown function (DUF2637)